MCGGLVQDEQTRPHDHDARDRDALLLAAGEGEWFALREVRDPEALHDGIDAPVHLAAWHAEVLEPERELVADGRLRCRELVRRRAEDDPDAAEQRRGLRRAGRVDAIDRRRPADRCADDARDEPRSQEREGGLARAGPPGDPDALPGHDREIDAGERGYGAPRVSDAGAL